MPFLRRRGNMASEMDIRRHTLFDEPENTSSTDNPVAAPFSSAFEAMAYDDIGIGAQQCMFGSEPYSEQSTTDPETSNKFRRFSIMRYRNASDSQLSFRAKQQTETPPPIPQTPAIITTAPSNDFVKPKKVTSRMNLAAKFRRSSDSPPVEDRVNHFSIKDTPKRLTTPEVPRQPTVEVNGQEHDCCLAQATAVSSSNLPKIPAHDEPDPSQSDLGTANRVNQSIRDTNPKKPHVTTPFLKFRRSKKTPEPLFSLTHLPQKRFAQSNNLSPASLAVVSRPASSQGEVPRAGGGVVEEGQFTHNGPTATLLARDSVYISGQSSPTKGNLLRGRSSTMSSLGRDSQDDHLLAPTTRASTSTGRKSFGDLFGLGRIRQNSELGRQGTLTPATPGSVGSKSNSLQLPRNSIVLPERQDDESPAKYLARVERVVNRGAIASVLAKGTDAFSTSVLRSYMRSFSFFGDPMDMAIRKLLMEAQLPKETQQIDRCLQAFANRYHECNPGIYSSPDQAYFIAFSLLILHTDVFNKNNRHKMQKSDYLKNTRGEGIFDDILECFYDNISYTPFIYVEDDLDLASERTHVSKSRRKQNLAGNTAESAKKAAKEPIDPYTLILDGNLDALRPNLKETMHLEDHYNYLGTAPSFNLRDLRNTFFKTGVLQIVSARSRPDAFMSEQTATNPNDAHPGIVDIKVTKVGLLWRKDAKKRKARSPWQEWGAILTGAQLYFFRNTSWVKNLMHQHDNHLRGGHDGIPVIFKPPLEEFKPDALMSTHSAVALLDTTYKKHKNAFVYVRQEGLDEILLADSEEERNDWLAKLNYAAAFRTSGVRMRGVVGSNYDGQGRRGIRRLDSSDGTQTVETPTGLVSIARGRIDQKMAEDIQVARRDGMQQKIIEADKKVDECQKQLEEQLRNARHLQILAPIQPRTRDQLLLAAARLSAQLKWARMKIWRERCHRDILMQDLADDEAILHNANKQLSPGNSTTIIRPSATGTEPNSRGSAAAERSSRTITAESSMSHVSGSIGHSQDTDLPPKVVCRPFSQAQETACPHTPATTARHGSMSSLATSTNQKSPLSSSASPNNTIFDPEIESTSKTSDNQDDVDAGERDFLKQAGLWEAKSRQSSVDKALMSASGEGSDHILSLDRDKLDRSKIRRSLQQTLREGAGHLSHHRSKKGRDANTTAATSLENVPQEGMLSRGTGSFVVHGKKASVINLGTELQTFSQDDIISSRKQPVSLHSQQMTGSPAVGDQHNLDCCSALEVCSELNNSSRRSSTASADTSTTRNISQIHRDFSSVHTLRSVCGTNSVVPSDAGDGTAMDGQQPTQLAAKNGIETEVKISYPDSETTVNSEEGTKLSSSDDENDANIVEVSTQREHDAFSNHHIQAVTA